MLSFRTGMIGGVAALVLAACGSTSDDGINSGGGKDIPLADIPPLLADAFCSSVRRCLGDLAELSGLGDDCTTEQTKAIEDGEIGLIEDAVDAGTVKYDGTKVQGCIDSIKNASCDDLQTRAREECEAAVNGTVAEGGDCMLDAECDGADLFCKVQSSCPGKCTKLLSVGDECKDSDDCGDGLDCSDATDRCVKPAAPGESCGGGIAPDCELGLACQGDDEEMGVTGACTDPANVFSEKRGDPCDFDSSTLCEIGSFCAITGIGMMGLETECVAEAPSGGTCNLAIPSMCPADELCSVTVELLMTGVTEGTCEALPGPGQPCAETFGSGACVAGSTCIDGTCAAVQRLGGGCTDDAGCYSENCQSGACAPPDPCNR